MSKVVVRGARAVSADESHEPDGVVMGRSSPTIFLSIPLICFALQCHIQCPAIFYDLKDGNVRFCACCVFVVVLPVWLRLVFFFSGFMFFTE